MARRLSNKEIRALEKGGLLQISKKDVVEIDNEKGFDILMVNSKSAYFKQGSKWVPTINWIYEHGCSLKSVVVDMGAVRFISNGADIMRPGIVSIDDGIVKGEIVAIREERHGKVLALGKALFDSEQMKSLKTGKVIINMHYVGDWLWDRDKL